MFSRFSFGVSSKKTFKPVKGHQGGSKREELHQFTRKTLGRCVCLGFAALVGYVVRFCRAVVFSLSFRSVVAGDADAMQCS